MQLLLIIGSKHDCYISFMAHIVLKRKVILLILNYINQNETVLYDEINFIIAI